jgi:hypothetical protein
MKRILIFLVLLTLFSCAHHTGKAGRSTSSLGSDNLSIDENRSELTSGQTAQLNMINDYYHQIADYVKEAGGNNTIETPLRDDIVASIKKRQVGFQQVANAEQNSMNDAVTKSKQYFYCAWGSGSLFFVVGGSGLICAGKSGVYVIGSAEGGVNWQYGVGFVYGTYTFDPASESSSSSPEGTFYGMSSGGAIVVGITTLVGKRSDSEDLLELYGVIAGTGGKATAAAIFVGKPFQK